MDIRWSYPTGADADQTRIYLHLDAVFRQGEYRGFLESLREQARLSAASVLATTQLAP